MNHSSLRSFGLNLLALCLLTTASNAAITINTTWTNTPPSEVQTVWASVVNYYTTTFSNSFAGETWNITADWKTISGGGIAEGGPRGNMTLGSTLKTQSEAMTFRIKDNVYYGSALANHLGKTTYVSGENLYVGFDNLTSWDFSTSSKATGKESLYATAIHEVAHGLGFISDDNGVSGGWDSNKPYVFDYYLGLGTGGTDPLIGKTNEQLAAAFVSDNVYWTGANGNNALGRAAKIFAPISYQSGSSMSHLDFSNNTAQSLLMYPSDAPGLPLAYSYSPLELGMMTDMGYDVVPEPSTVAFLLFSVGSVVVWGRFRLARET